MSPRVSEAARIFAVATFLVLIAQGPTFSGHASQLAAAGERCTQTMTKEGGMQTTCTNDAAKKEATIDPKTGKTEVKEDANDPCNSKNQGTKTWTDNKCDAKNGKEQATGSTKVTTPDGETEISCKPGEKCGMVVDGNGGGSGVSAASQYTDSKPYIAQVPITPPSSETTAAMNRAFPGVADGTVKLAYPVTPSGPETSNTGGSSPAAPVSSVPGTTLDNSQPVNLNPNTMQNIAALTPPQTGADTPSITTRSYISPSTGATLGTNGVAQASLTSDPLWKANQELGGIQSPVSPSQVFMQQLGAVPSYALNGSQFPIKIVDASGNTVATLNGEDYGISIKGGLTVSADCLTCNTTGLGSLNEKVANTLTNEFRNAGVDGQVVQTVFGTKNADTGHTLAQDVGQALALNEANKGLFTQLRENLSLDLFQGKQATLSVTGEFQVDPGSEPTQVAAKDGVTGVSQNQYLAAQLERDVKNLPGASMGVPVGSDATSLVKGFAGTPSGQGAQPILNKDNEMIASLAQRGFPTTQSGPALAHEAPVLGSSANLVSDVQKSGAEGTQSGPRSQSILNQDNPSLAGLMQQGQRGTQAGLEPVKSVDVPQTQISAMPATVSLVTAREFQEMTGTTLSEKITPEATVSRLAFATPEAVAQMVLPISEERIVADTPVVGETYAPPREEVIQATKETSEPAPVPEKKDATTAGKSDRTADSSPSPSRTESVPGTPAQSRAITGTDSRADAPAVSSAGTANGDQGAVQSAPSSASVVPPKPVTPSLTAATPVSASSNVAPAVIASPNGSYDISLPANTVLASTSPLATLKVAQKGGKTQAQESSPSDKSATMNEGASSKVATPNTNQAPTQGQIAANAKSPGSQCDDVNAHPSKYGAADIENCKSNTERKVAAILGGIASILNTINPFASSAAQAAPARTPMQLNYNLWGIKAPGGNAAEPAGLETGTLARSLCGGGGLTPREGFQQGGGRLMCNFASPEDAVAAYMSKIDAYCNKLGMCTPKQVVCTWVTGADCDISKLDTAYQNLVNKLGNIDLHNDANKVQFMIAQAVPENSISQFPYSQQQIDAGVQKWRASLGKTVATTQAPVTSPASAPPSVQISSVTKAVSSGIIRVALPPGEKPVASPTSASLQKDAGLQISVCVGTAKCGDGIQFNSRNYINPLCQKDLGCTASASELAGVPDAKYPEQAFKDPLSSQAQQYYQQQVERAAQNASQGRVLIDNCNNVDYAVCKTILDKLQAWNQQHPAQPVKAWINNAHFETDTNTLPLWSHPVAGGATVEQDIENPQESSPAYLDKRRQEAGVPGLPILFAGSEQYAAEVQRQIQQGGYPGMGTSGSKVGDGPNGFKTADATSAISGQAGPNTPVGAMQRFAQTAPAFVFGRSGADGKPELLDPKTAAQAQAKGEKLDVYENVKPLPFRAQQYTKVGDQYYQRAGTADEYAARQTAGAQAALQNGAYAQQLGSKMDKPVMIEGQGSTRPVYGLNADGSKGDPLGTLKTMSKEQVQLLNAAQKLGVELKECDTGYCTKDGKQAELRAENGGKPGDAPRTVGGVSGQNRRVWNPNVQARTPTTEERVGALKAAGVKVVDNRGAGAYPARSGAIVGEFVHGDLASGEKLVSYCAQTRKCYNDIVMEDGTVVMMGGTDKAPFHAFGAADYTNGIVVAGADGGRSATPAQLETVRKILSVDMDQFGWWVTTHGESAANSIGGRNINEAGPNVRAMIFDGGIPAGDQQLGLYLSDPANPNDRGTRFGDVFNASSLPPARESATFTSTDGKTIVGLDPVGDVGKATASLTTDSDGNLGVNYNYEAPKPPETPDTRSPIEKIRDAAADAQTKMRDMWKNMFGGGQQPAGGQQGGGGAQPANNAVPANNSRPAGGAAQPSSSGTPAPAPARTGQQPATTANGASGSQMPVVSVSGGNTATGISGERFTCSPGTVVNGSTATPLTIAWTCPAGTTSIGTGFSTLGTNSGSVQLVVSTTSASVNYQLTCQGAQASQTLSCAVQVRHPRVTLVAKPASVESGAPVQLQWSAFDVTSCSLYAPPTVLLVSGDTQGTANTLPLSHSSVFSALCNVGSATTTASVTVLVKGDTATPLQTVLPR